MSLLNQVGLLPGMEFDAAGQWTAQASDALCVQLAHGADAQLGLE